MRRPNRRKLKPEPKLVIVCEGGVTEPEYFDAIRRRRRIQKERVIIAKASGIPKTVVECAIKLKKENEDRNKLEGFSTTDMVWAVFDRDNHPEIPQAKQMANANGIRVGFSNPCFEVFLLWHFQDQARAEHRDVIARLLRKYIPDYDKHFDYDDLLLAEKYPNAKARAVAAEARSTIQAGIESELFSSIYELVDILEAM